MPTEKISLREAAKRGLTRLRQEQWVSPFDHLEITSLNGGLGIWARMWAPFNEACNGQDPVAIMVLQLAPDSPDWLPYAGHAPDSPEYLAERAACTATFNGK